MKLRDLFPRQFDFFSMFNTLAQLVGESASIFSRMLEDPRAVEELSAKIHDLEEEADRVVHGTIEKLHQTFITPMDRNNMHLLLLRVDDLVDLIHAASQRIYLYKMERLSSDIRGLGELACQSIGMCCKLIQSLDNLKNPSELQKLCISINQIENAADTKMRQAMANLFEHESDFKSFIKQKELIEILEELTDKGEGVAHLVEALILEHS